MEKIREIAQFESVHRVTYAENPEVQKHGIDGFLTTKKPTVDTKTRGYDAYRYHDILIETLSIRERDILGWFYTTNADVIAYVWTNSSGTNLVDGYLLFMSDSVRQWFETNKNQFKVKIAHSKAKGKEWTTENRAVPISQFPKGTLYRFNPQIDFGQDSKLGEFS